MGGDMHLSIYSTSKLVVESAAMDTPGVHITPEFSEFGRKETEKFENSVEEACPPQA